MTTFGHCVATLVVVIAVSVVMGTLWEVWRSHRLRRRDDAIRDAYWEEIQRRTRPPHDPWLDGEDGK